MIIRDANPSDAQNLAQLMNIAGSGMPLTRWRQLARKSEDPWDVGNRQVRAESGEFSFQNCRVVQGDGGAVCAMLNSFVMTDELTTDEVPWPSFADPIQTLEATCVGSYYINFVATFDAYQSNGFAGALLDDAERQAKLSGVSSVKLIVLESKKDVVRLYQHLGYVIIERIAAKAMGNMFLDDHWLLMRKDIRIFEKD